MIDTVHWLAFRKKLPAPFMTSVHSDTVQESLHLQPVIHSYISSGPQQWYGFHISCLE